MSDPIRAGCHRDFFPAAHSSGLRSRDLVYWVVLHDEEADTAASAARFFRDPKSGGSAHLCVDGGVCYRCLADDVIPWGARSAPQLSANTRGFHIEQAGFARWAQIVWLRHSGTLERAALKAAQACHRFGLPAVWVGADQLVDGARRHRLPKGVTTHAEITAASKRLDPEHAFRYDHTDPGFGWPRRRFVRRVRFYLAEIERGGL